MLCVFSGCKRKAIADDNPIAWCEVHHPTHHLTSAFIVTTFKGFGKGRTLKEAVDQYQKANGRLDLKAPYQLHVFKAASLDDIGIDLLNWHTSNFAQHIAQG